MGKNDKQYLTTNISGTYELVNSITDKTVVKQIVEILKLESMLKIKMILDIIIYYSFILKMKL